MSNVENLTINLKGYLLDLDIPKVMGILNVTPDSFYRGSRSENEDEIRKRVRRMVSEGVDIIDIGGCSTRPGFAAPALSEEITRVSEGCRIVREEAPDIPVSVDTYRASVAREVIEKWDADIINDISGGIDPEMWPLIAHKRVAYVLTHNHMDGNTLYGDITADVISELSKKLNELHRMGVNDVILDPGFGFAKSLEDNFRLFKDLDEIARMGFPLLVGISRKSMIYKTLECSPEESLAGTVALDAIALEKGAHILRVHDVKEAVETVKLYTRLK